MPAYKGRPLTWTEKRRDLLLQAISRCNWLADRLMNGPDTSTVDLTYFSSRLAKWGRIRDSLYRLLGCSSDVSYETTVHGPSLFAQPAEASVAA